MPYEIYVVFGLIAGLSVMIIISYYKSVYKVLKKENKK